GRKLVPGKGLGDVVADGGRAVHGREHADEVARARLTARAQEAVEARAFALGHVRGRADVGAECVVAIEVAHLDVVHVHVLAGRDVRAREADDLVVFDHRLAGPDRAGRVLVPGGNARRAGDVLAGERGVRQEVDARGHDIVVRVQAHGQGRVLTHGRFFRVDR